MRRVAVGALALISLGLTACSPSDLYTWSVRSGNTTFVHTRAKAGPDDGRGSSFRTATVCNGHNWWTRGNAVNVNEGTPDANGYFRSTAACYDGREPVGITVERW